jgi:hypothetical protein
MKTIPLSQGKFAIVDDEDFVRLNQFKWFAFKNHQVWYSGRNDRTGPKRKTVYLHHEVLRCPTSRQVDHRDRDGLNNQKYNLRYASNVQNQMNKVGWGKVGLKGVRIQANHKGSNPFQARIQLNGKVFSLGTYPTSIEAAKAYNAKALELFGQFARLNPV